LAACAGIEAPVMSVHLEEPVLAGTEPTDRLEDLGFEHEWGPAPACSPVSGNSGRFRPPPTVFILMSTPSVPRACALLVPQIRRHEHLRSGAVGCVAR
jgi:hypothetical protein